MDWKRLSLLNRMSIIFLVITLCTNAALAQNKLNIYGFFSTRFEKVFTELSIDENGQTVKESAPSEWSFPFFNIMLQHYISDNFRAFANLNGSGAENITLSNFWGEYSPARSLNLRLGKTYRKFGLYNEILDAVPTYYGIAPPELFDGDHLIVSRTTTLMGYGSVGIGSADFNYSLSTDNGEGGPSKETLPLGWDFNLRFGAGDYILGFSGYTSGGPTTSDVALGEGPPNTGVLPWMAEDDFIAIGGYGEARVGDGLIQAAYWHANHKAIRDPESVVEVVENAGINDAQRARFLKIPGGPATVENVNTIGDYDIDTWYIRAGYSFDISIGEIGPYFQWDYYKNPETIQNKKYGGDNEAGLADDGKFHKGTLGIVLRPVPEVAVKLDGSTHIQRFNGVIESYSEIRLDISFIFGP